MARSVGRQPIAGQNKAQSMTMTKDVVDFQKILETAPDLYLILTPDFKIVSASNAYLKVVMDKCGAILGRDIFDVLSKHMQEAEAIKLRASFEQVLQSKQPNNITMQIYDIDNKLRFFSCINIPVLKNNKIDYILQRMEDSAKSGNFNEEVRYKSEFLANMSHELRTPLNAIIGFAELMYTEKVGQVSSQHKEFLNDILISARHLLQLINDILDISKIEAGKMELYPKQIDLKKLINEVNDLMRNLLAKKHISLSIEISPDLPTIVIDPGKLKQILYNYLSNAIKFSPQQAKITISVQPDGHNHFKLMVCDNGVGIRSEDIPKLFVEFTPSDSRLTQKPSEHVGSGFGLTLTKRIVEAQGGVVGVESIYGKGSTFYAILPCQSTHIIPHRSKKL